METRIFFNASTTHGKLHVDVRMDADEIADAVAEADGLPFHTVAARTGATVYVNPGAIAYWYEKQ